MGTIQVVSMDRNYTRAIGPRSYSSCTHRAQSPSRQFYIILTRCPIIFIWKLLEKTQWGAVWRRYYNCDDCPRYISTKTILYGVITETDVPMHNTLLRKNSVSRISVGRNVQKKNSQNARISYCNNGLVVHTIGLYTRNKVQQYRRLINYYYNAMKEKERQKEREREKTIITDSFCRRSKRNKINHR